MIRVSLLGGAAKSFGTKSLDVELSDVSIEFLLEHLQKTRPADALPLDSRNLLVAVNGTDSSALGGRGYVIKDGDAVSIIPVIHGGAPARYRMGGRHVEFFSTKRGQAGVALLDSLRAKFPDMEIQGISMSHVAGPIHAKKILAISLAASRRGLLLSKSLEMDILMRFAGTAQIASAIKSAGMKPGSDALLVAVGAPRRLDILTRFARDSLRSPPVFPRHDAAIKRKFGITKRHLDAVESRTPISDILAERAAILS